MNGVQKKTFELLEIFVNICHKWNIPYYLVCGSALGAVKYGGFIPWDDDIDVALLREDYQKFLEVAPQELPQWCFLQNFRTEKNYPHISSKLRNSNTAFIEEGMESLPINHGIYLDIFPIDGHPSGLTRHRIFEMRKKWNEWILFSAMKLSGNRKVRFRNKVMRILGFHKRVFQSQLRLEKLYCSYPPQKSKLWCNYGNWQGKLEYSPRWHYGDGVWVAFEGLNVRIPERYDDYLTQKYGDWRSDPPVEKQRSHHMAVVDVEHSYKDFVK